jgi:hypothetical protein
LRLRRGGGACGNESSGSQDEGDAADKPARVTDGHVFLLAA